MEKILHRAQSRGHANHGWLDSYHTFSFAEYYDKERLHFGALRVLNEDRIAPSQGFGTHPHDNMEIISIPLTGTLAHQDSTGKETILRPNEVQIMSAGRGILHSEYNASSSEEAHFLQIWVYPKEKNIAPRYEQRYFSVADRQNQWQYLVSPEPESGLLWINQNAYFAWTELEAGRELEYLLHSKNQVVYFFVIEGEVEVANESLKQSDGIGFLEEELFHLKSVLPSRVLVMEVPKDRKN